MSCACDSAIASLPVRSLLRYVLSVLYGVRKPAGTRRLVEAVETVTSESDQNDNCRWSTGVGRFGTTPRQLALATPLTPNSSYKMPLRFAAALKSEREH